MLNLFNAKRGASAVISRSPSRDGTVNLTLNETGDYHGADVLINAPSRMLAEWAKLILREVEPAALAPEMEAE